MILNQEKPPLSEAILQHYGVKGMKWGVRKKQSLASNVSLQLTPKGVRVKADGSITVDSGASLQRLVRSNGKSLPMKDLTYVSMLEYDNARYIKSIGGKGIFGGGRDQILSIKATKPIKAPPVKVAVAEHSKLMLKDQEFQKRNTNAFTGTQITKRELDAIARDPGGKTAEAWYQNGNIKFTFDSKNPDVDYVQKKLRASLEAKGYNAVRDENDFQSKLSKAPLIVFSPEKSLSVVSTTQITDELRKANKEKLRAYKAQGKDWMDRELYS